VGAVLISPSGSGPAALIRGYHFLSVTKAFPLVLRGSTYIEKSRSVSKKVKVNAPIVPICFPSRSDQSGGLTQAKYYVRRVFILCYEGSYSKGLSKLRS
jgi:hypothetical protein